ncbi:MAG: adenosine deaminase [Gemmatimonadetes bacterium]|nr:adenosine deaminase [Gemmatimonadota bacterium]
MLLRNRHAQPRGADRLPDVGRRDPCGARGRLARLSQPGWDGERGRGAGPVLQRLLLGRLHGPARRRPEGARAEQRRHGVLTHSGAEVSRERLLALPKPELHVHLDGSLRPATLRDLARERGQPLPTQDLEALARHMVASDTRSLVEYLQRFDITLSVMQDAAAIERIAYELAEDNARENVRWLEVRYCPALNTCAGLTSEASLEAALRGLRRAEADFPIRTGLIVCALRHRGTAESTELAELAVSLRDRGVVAFDLAGPEDGYPPRLHHDAFQTAARANLPVTIHAGEAYGPESIRQALQECGARRIGHGTRLGEDPALLEWVRDFQIPLEVCVTSNVQTGVVRSHAEHHLRAYYDADVAVTLATDNRLISGITLTDEYWTAHRELGFSWPELVEIADTGFRTAFLPADERAAMVDRIREEIAALA